MGIYEYTFTNVQESIRHTVCKEILGKLSFG